MTGSRADYGLLYWTIKSISEDKELELQLLVTGMHLSKKFGNTYKQIEKDGFEIKRKIKCLKDSDSPEAISDSVGTAISGLSKAYSELNPDIILVVGDRFESFAAVAAALPFCIPVAHCHGGELTLGAIDEAYRHAMTKMSQLHFVSAECHRQRVIQLGENPANVHVSGALSIENIRRLKLLNRKKLEKELKFKFAAKNILITFHPETLNHKEAGNQVKKLLAALNGIKDAKFIFTLPNADTGGKVIIELIQKFVSDNPLNSCCFASVGTLKYMSLLAQVDVVLGNSSSGIIEAPSMGTLTINVGDRQKGRIRAKSVIDVPVDTASIRKALTLACSGQFKQVLQNLSNPYDYGLASRVIVRKLKSANLKKLVHKSFFDI